MTYDCSFDYIEPTLEINVEPDHLSDNTTELHDQFSKLKIKKNVFETNFTDDENNESSLNDFHLAETDLIKCLLRTNIIQRIRYEYAISLNIHNITPCAIYFDSSIALEINLNFYIFTYIF